jgi:amino acid adenylation domain-containing protein
MQLKLIIFDISSLPEDGSEDVLWLWADTEYQRPFDLTHSLRLRVALFRLDIADHVMFLSAYAMSCDLRALDLLIHELAPIYRALSANIRVELPESYIQRGKPLIWPPVSVQMQQNDWQPLGTEMPALKLPTDRPRLTTRHCRRAEHLFEMPRTLATALYSLSQCEGTSLCTTLLAAFQTLLYRYTGEENILVGVIAANYEQPERPDPIGVYTKIFAVCTDLSENPSFCALLRRVDTACAWAPTIPEFPSSTLIEPHISPLYVTFEMRSVELPLPSIPDMQLQRLNIPATAPSVDLALIVLQNGEDLIGSLVYDTDLFEASTISRAAAHIQTLLASIAAHPEQHLADLPLLTAEERDRLLKVWNATGRDYPSDQCIHQLFEAQVSHRPDAIAVAFEDTCLTYAELNRRANRLAHLLCTLGVGPERATGICLHRSPDLVVGLLAILKAGGAYVPLDPTYPRERLMFMLEDIQPAVVLTESRLAATLPFDSAQHPASHVRARVLCMDVDGRMLDLQSAENVTRTFSTDQLAYIMYTSGSSGRPKGICVSHRNVVRLVQSSDYISLNDAEILLQLAPISFDAATFEIWGSLLNGARLVLFPARLPALDELGQALLRYQISTLWLTAGLFHLMAEEQAESLQHVRHLLAGGDILSSAHANKVLQTTRPGWLINGYGPTENTTFTCCYAMPHGHITDHTVPIGTPIANTQVFVLDRFMQPVPVGVPGELYAGGDGLARGYLGRPDLTAQRFVPNPFAEKRGVRGERREEIGQIVNPKSKIQNGLRLYRTGDLVRWRPDGTIEFLGRIDQQVKIRGFRVEPGEIEAVLHQHASVREAVVLAHKHKPSEQRLVAYVVPNDGAGESGQATGTDASALTAELYSCLAQRLPEYMVPADVVLLDALPLTPNGKIDRRALLAIDTTVRPNEHEYVAPRTPVELVLVDIWANVLGIPHVSTNDNFFALGGHSLLASQIMARVRRAFRVDLSLAHLFNAPTVVELAAAIELIGQEQREPEFPAIQPAGRSDALPLSFSQERIWFLNQLVPGNIAYNAQVTVRFSGPLHLATLARTFSEIVHRHEIFRTTFEAISGHPVQIIHPPTDVIVPLIDLCALPSHERELVAEQLSIAEFRRSFDIMHLPLVRWSVLRLTLNDHILVQVEHHFVHDGWSLNILFREIKAIYSAFTDGEPTPLIDPPLQYVDFAIWQRQLMQGPLMETQLSYWKAQLAGLPSQLDLHPDHPRPKFQSFQGRAQRVELPPPLYNRLRMLSREHGVTLFMTLLATFKALLYRYTEQTDLVVGSAVANRRLRETEGLIGMIVNNVVLRTMLSGDLPFHELLERVRKVTLEAYTYQDLPFDKLVEALRPERDPSRNPLFQVMFSFHDSPMPDLEFAGLVGDMLVRYNGSAKFDLNIVVIPRAEQRIGQSPSPSDEHISMIWEYSTDLFDDATMSRMTRHFQQLLEGVCAEPSQQIARVPLLTEEEQRQIALWNATAAAYPYDTCIHEVIAAQAARTPDAIAVVFAPAPPPPARPHRPSRGSRSTSPTRSSTTAPTSSPTTCAPAASPPTSPSASRSRARSPCSSPCSPSSRPMLPISHSTPLHRPAASPSCSTMPTPRYSSPPTPPTRPRRAGRTRRPRSCPRSTSPLPPPRSRACRVRPHRAPPPPRSWPI